MGVLQSKQSILWQAQEKVSELAHAALEKEYKGLACDNIYRRAYQILTYIRALERENGNLEDFEVERILSCIVEAAQINTYPTPPVIGQISRPTIEVGARGIQGPQGAAGTPGTNANVDVDSEIDDIVIEEVIIGGVKTFVLRDNSYIAPETGCSIDRASLIGLDPDQDKVIEKGMLVNPDINQSITRGRDPVQSYMATPVDPGFDLPTINLGSQALTLSEIGIDSNRTYTVSASDGTSNISKSDTLTFVYPFLYGEGDSQDIDYYAILTKLIEKKGNKVITFNGTNKYFMLAYPASYGVLSQILDQNGFDVTGSFTRLDVDMDSQGLDADWVDVPYYVYVTNDPTTIISHPYTFKF